MLEPRPVPARIAGVLATAAEPPADLSAAVSKSVTV